MESKLPVRWYVESVGVASQMVQPQLATSALLAPSWPPDGPQIYAMGICKLCASMAVEYVNVR
jgi:hypothetical protein